MRQRKIDNDKIKFDIIIRVVGVLHWRFKKDNQRRNCDDQKNRKIHLKQ